MRKPCARCFTSQHLGRALGQGVDEGAAVRFAEDAVVELAVTELVCDETLLVTDDDDVAALSL